MLRCTGTGFTIRSSLIRGLIAVFAMLEIVTIAQAVPWYNLHWTYRRRVTVNSAWVSNDFSDFTVLLHLTNSDFIAHAESGGSDFVITTDDGITRCSREIEQYTATNGHLVLWFKAPAIARDTDTDFYLYYGNWDAVETNSAFAWNSDYRLVQHFNEIPTNMAMDSTTNSMDMQCRGGMTNSDLVTGAIGNGFYFDGANHYLYHGNNAQLNFGTGSFTISAWGRPTDNARRLVMWKRQRPYNTYDGYFLGRHDSAMMIQINDYYDALPHEETAGIGTGYAGAWHHFVGVVDRETVNGSIRFYSDGQMRAEDNDISVAPNVNSSYAYTIGYNFEGVAAQGNYWLGELDEIRLAVGAKTADWIATEFNNQSAPWDFLTMAAEEKVLSGTLIMLR